ncbi:hypothetical protein ACM66B_006228 [Microbotryomycetes sp. NB124-2]
MALAPLKRQRNTDTGTQHSSSRSYVNGYTPNHLQVEPPRKRVRSSSSQSAAPTTQHATAGALGKLFNWGRTSFGLLVRRAKSTPQDKRRQQHADGARSSSLASHSQNTVYPQLPSFKRTQQHFDNVKRNSLHHQLPLGISRSPFKHKTPQMPSASSSKLVNGSSSAARQQLLIQDDDEDDERYAEQNLRRQARKMELAMAKASGQPLPPPPPQRTASVRQDRYIKKQPMGQLKLKKSIERAQDERRAQLHNETYSLAWYRRMAAQTQAQDPLNQSGLTTTTLTSNKTRPDPKRVASGSLSRGPQETRRIADEISKTPRPATPTHDALLERLRKVDLESKALDTPKQRRRKFPQRLSRKDQEIVDNQVFGDRRFSSSIDGAAVEYSDIARLRGLTWLNDEIITFYAQMINARAAKAEQDPQYNESLKEHGTRLRKVHCFNSFFYNGLSAGGHKKVKRWTKRVDLFAKDIVIVPINHGNAHWVCSAINVRDKRIEYYDSLNGTNPAVFKRLRDYIAEEHRVKKGTELDLSDWIDYTDENVPQQSNSSDCGVFTAQFMECLSREVEGFDFTQAQMPYFRNKMALELKEQRLIPEENWVDVA